MPTFDEIRDEMDWRDADAAAADAAVDRRFEAERDAERAAEESAVQTVVDRRVEYELAFGDELRRLVAERGGTAATTHDVANATANVGFRFGQQVDHWAIQEALEHDPEPVGPDYRPIR